MNDTCGSCPTRVSWQEKCHYKFICQEQWNSICNPSPGEKGVPYEAIILGNYGERLNLPVNLNVPYIPLSHCLSPALERWISHLLLFNENVGGWWITLFANAFVICTSFPALSCTRITHQLRSTKDHDKGVVTVLMWSSWFHWPLLCSARGGGETIPPI